MLSDLQVHWDPAAGARLPEKGERLVLLDFHSLKLFLTVKILLCSRFGL